MYRLQNWKIRTMTYFFRKVGGEWKLSSRVGNSRASKICATNERFFISFRRHGITNVDTYG